MRDGLAGREGDARGLASCWGCREGGQGGACCCVSPVKGAETVSGLVYLDSTGAYTHHFVLATFHCLHTLTREGRSAYMRRLITSVAILLPAAITDGRATSSDVFFGTASFLRMGKRRLRQLPLLCFGMVDQLSLVRCTWSASEHCISNGQSRTATGRRNAGKEETARKPQRACLGDRLARLAQGGAIDIAVLMESYKSKYNYSITNWSDSFRARVDVGVTGVPNCDLG